jgi:hypothetical protein
MWLALVALCVNLAVPSSHAAPTCDVKALGKALTEAVPNQAGKAFAELAACDPAAANKAAPEAFKKILAGETGDAAVVVAIGVGAGESVRAWVNVQEPDDRSRTISKLGEKCDQAGVPAFFLDTATTLGEKFWTDRWSRGLDDCRQSLPGCPVASAPAFSSAGRVVVSRAPRQQLYARRHERFLH